VNLRPFILVDGVAFSITPEQLLAQLGRPLRQERNDVGLNEWDYGEEVYRFQDSGRLEEVTKRASAIHVEGVAVPFSSLQGFVAAHDPAVFERAGFVVSPRYGLAFAPESPNWVTALAKHCIGTWEEIRITSATGPKRA
jgi:hypothetical protein